MSANYTYTYTARITALGPRSAVPDRPDAVDAEISVDGRVLGDVTLLTREDRPDLLCTWGSLAHWAGHGVLEWVSGAYDPDKVEAVIVAAVQTAWQAHPREVDFDDLDALVRAANCPWLEHDGWEQRAAFKVVNSLRSQARARQYEAAQMAGAARARARDPFTAPRLWQRSSAVAYAEARAATTAYSAACAAFDTLGVSE